MAPAATTPAKPLKPICVEKKEQGDIRERKMVIYEARDIGLGNWIEEVKKAGTE